MSINWNGLTLRQRRALPTMKEPRKRKGAKRARAKRLFEDNSLYGKIPLLARSYPLGMTGKTYTAYEYDLDYAPPLPHGAVRANPHLQNVSEFSVPRYYYVAEEIQHEYYKVKAPCWGQAEC